MDKFQEYKINKSTSLRNEIALENIGIAEIIAKKYRGRGVDYDDLYQTACLALLKAVERFDPDKGYVFSTFASSTIIGEIKRYFRDKTWSVKVPRQIKEL